MATKTFVVHNYKVAAGVAMTATWGGTSIKAQGYLACRGSDHRLIVYGLTEQSQVPPPMYVVGNKVGAIFVPFHELAAYIDLVRNEKPVYAYLNSDKPEWINLRTAAEPVGEEES